MKTKIKKLRLKDYCGWKNLELDFEDFACLIGTNGVGKTTVLNAVSLLCSSLDYKQSIKPNVSVDQEAVDSSVNPGEWQVEVSAQARMKAFLQKNIRNFGEPEAAQGFAVEGVFERDGKTYEVEVTENGFIKNEMISQSWWWPGIVYFAKFDVDMVNFQLRREQWPKFKEAYEGITGFEVDPEIYNETELEAIGLPSEIVTGFYLHKWGSRVHSRRCSAGEKKIAKALTQIINLEEERLPDIVLVDNLEMHVHYSRHLKMFSEIKRIFNGLQVIATTHSTVIIEKYEPKTHLIDLEAVRFLETL